MNRKRTAILAVATVAVAGVAGHVMQRMAGPDHPGHDLAAVPHATPERIAAQPAAQPTTAAVAPQVAPTPAKPAAGSEDARLTAWTDPNDAPAGRAAGAAPQPAPTESAAVPPATDRDRAAATFRPQPPMTEAPADPPAPSVGALADAEAARGVDTTRNLRMALASISELPDPDAPAHTAQAAEADDPCAPEIFLLPGPAATIDIAFDAACHPGAQAVVRHGGMAVSARLSPSGALDLTIPALSTAAAVVVDVRGGPAARGTVDVPDLDAFERVILQWQGDDLFQLHAYEAGAALGSDGHVWRDNPHAPLRAVLGEGGFLLELGSRDVDWPLLAQVYTAPARPTDTGPTQEVALHVEAALTPATCGREMLAEATLLQAGKPAERTEITLPLPECDTDTGFLVLKNLLQDLSIAGN